MEDSQVSQVDGGKVWTPSQKELNPTPYRSYDLLSVMGMSIVMLTVLVGITSIPFMLNYIQEYKSPSSSVETKTGVKEPGLVLPGRILKLQAF